MVGGTSPRRRARLVALLLGILAGLALAEVGVRLWIGAPLPERLPVLMIRANPGRGWEMVPGEHYTYEHRVEVNSLGLRGPELAPKLPDERRILFLGDSLTYGQGVGDDETVPVALERALRRREPARPWTVVNAGHRGYDTTQELALLRELGPRIQPDVVRLGWYWNDLNPHDVRAMYEHLEGKGEVAFDTGRPMEGIGRMRWGAGQLLRRSALLMFLRDALLPNADPFDAAVVEQGLRRLETELADFRAAASAFSARPVFVGFPDLHALLGSEVTRPFEERAAGLARDQGLLVVELLAA